MPDEYGLWCPSCGSATQAEILGWCPMCDWKRGRRKKPRYETRGFSEDSPEFAAAIALEVEDADSMRPPGMKFPPRQEPAEAIRQLPYEVRRDIRTSAIFVAKWSRTGVFDGAEIRLLNPIIDQTCEWFRKRRIAVAHEAVEAYFRKAFRDAEAWYAADRAKRSKRRGQA